jgi:hypothetical protein
MWALAGMVVLIVALAVWAGVQIGKTSNSKSEPKGLVGFGQKKPEKIV